MSKSFFLLWTGQLVSLLGSSLTGFAVSLWIFDQTQSSFWLSFAVFTKLLPSIYLSLFAGHLVDRVPLTRLIAVSNFLLLLLTLVTALGLYFQLLSISGLMIFLFLSGVVESVLNLTFQSSTAQLAKPDFYMRSQGVVTLVENGPLMLAPILGLLAYEHLGFFGILLFDAATYIFALFFLKGVEFPKLPVSAPAAWSAGIQRIWGHPRLRRLQAHFFIANFSNGLLAGLVSALVLTMTLGDKKGLALTNTASALGLTLGSLFVLFVPIRTSLFQVIAGGTLVSAITGRMILGLFSSVTLWAFGLGLRNFLNPLVSSANQTLWVEVVPAHERGIVFGARRLLGQGLYPIAVLLGAFLSETQILNLPQLFLLVGGLEALLGILAFWYFKSGNLGPHPITDRSPI